MAKIQNYLMQEGNHLICKKPCTIKVDLNLYSLGDNLIISETSVWFAGIVSRIFFDDIDFDLVLDYPVSITFQEIKKEAKTLVFKFGANSVVLETSIDVSEARDEIIYIKRLLSGKEVSKNPSHLLLKLYALYKTRLQSSADLVHFEVTLSNVLRDKSNPSIPARLARRFDPVLLNVNSVVFQESFLSGIEFERITKALETGLISDRPRETSPLEKILLGELI